MAVTTRAPRRFYYAFVLDPDRLKRIWAIVNEDQNGQIEFETTDGSVHKTDDFNDLINFDNSKSRRIVSLDFSNYRNPVTMKIQFEDDPRIWLNFSGDPAMVATTEVKIMQILEGARISFLVFAKSFLDNPHKVWIAIIFAAGLVVQTLLLFYAIDLAFWFANHPISKMTDEQGGLLGSAILSLSTFIYLFLTAPYGTSIARKVFPPASYLIGDGAKRFERAARIRQTIWIAIGIGTVVSIVAGLITSWIQRLGL